MTLLERLAQTDPSRDPRRAAHQAAFPECRQAGIDHRHPTALWARRAQAGRLPAKELIR